MEIHVLINALCRNPLKNHRPIKAFSMYAINHYSYRSTNIKVLVNKILIFLSIIFRVMKKKHICIELLSS